MKSAIWGALVMAACSTKTTTVTHDEGGARDAGGSAGGAAIDIEKFDIVALAIDEGDGWKDAVTRLAAVAGPPNIVDGDRLAWFVAATDHCTAVHIGPEREFVKSINVQRLYHAGDDYQPCTDSATKHAALPRVLPEPGTYALDAPAQAVMAQWRDGSYQQLYDEAHPAMREAIDGPDAIAHLARLFEPITGKYVKLGAPLAYSTKHFGYFVTGPAEFERGTVTVELGFRIADGKPQLSDLNLKLPPELQRHPEPADAEKLGRRALDALLAKRFPALLELTSMDLAKKVREQPDLEHQLAEVLRPLGKVKNIALSEQKECDGDQCLTYAVTTAKGTATATLTATFAVSRWELDAFNLVPDE